MMWRSGQPTDSLLHTILVQTCRKRKQTSLSLKKELRQKEKHADAFLTVQTLFLIKLTNTCVYKEKKEKGKKKDKTIYIQKQKARQVKKIKKITRRETGNKTPRKTNLQNKKKITGNNQKTNMYRDKRGLSQVAVRQAEVGPKHRTRTQRD